MYDITSTHFRDLSGKFLWAEPLQEEHRLFKAGEEIAVPGDEIIKVKYRVERVALVENTQHVNVAVVPEDVNIVEPYL